MRRTAFWAVALLMTLLLLGEVGFAQDFPPANGVSILVTRNNANVRIVPALGAELAGTVNTGFTAPATGRSADGQWVRIDFHGQEAWIGLPVIAVFGDLESLPVRDPRTIPFGGFESPRAGTTSATSPISGRLAQSGLRVRAGPGPGYPVLANAPRFTVFPLLGRTASNLWLQANFEGTLGWVSARYVELQDGANILQLPIGGVVAESLPVSQPTQDDFVTVLRFMGDRLDLAQPALDAIRAIWTNVALGQRQPCGNFPARPSDINIAQPLLAAFFPTLDPLRALFNEAMGNLRAAIDLWIEACSFPGAGLVGQATAQGALGRVNEAEAQFAELRRRLDELIPGAAVPGGDECLFTFGGRSDLVPLLMIGELGRGRFEGGQRAVGFCFDAMQGQSLRFEALRINGIMQQRISVSSIDDPTNFIAVATLPLGGDLASAQPVLIPATGRYLMIVSDTESEAPEGDFAVLISNITGISVVGPGLMIDPVTGDVIVLPLGGATTPLLPTPATGVGGFCPSPTFTCQQLISCNEAFACLQQGNTSLDPDFDGVPCEETLCIGFGG